MNKYKKITDYLNFITQTYHLQITINDFSGFLQVDRELLAAVQPYMIHKNPYCMQIKSSKKLWDRCLRMKKKLLSKCERIKGTYYGMCYCGVEEYIVPILCNGIVIGLICAGEFSTNPKAAEYSINKIARENSMDPSLLKKKFEQSVRKENYDLFFIDSILGIVAEYFSSFYSNLTATHKTMYVQDKSSRSGEAYILSHAIEYIRQNFNERITVEEVAAFCHCSDSYISHIFKKNMKMNIKAYINKMRVEQSKVYLIHCNDTVAEISLKVGFNDPNYFTSVFTNTAGITPTQFRKRFREAKLQPTESLP